MSGTYALAPHEFVNLFRRSPSQAVKILRKLNDEHAWELWEPLLSTCCDNFESSPWLAAFKFGFLGVVVDMASAEQGWDLLTYQWVSMMEDPWRLDKVIVVRLRLISLYTY